MPFSNAIYIEFVPDLRSIRKVQFIFWLHSIAHTFLSNLSRQHCTRATHFKVSTMNNTKGLKLQMPSLASLRAEMVFEDKRTVSRALALRNKARKKSESNMVASRQRTRTFGPRRDYFSRTESLESFSSPTCTLSSHITDTADIAHQFVPPRISLDAYFQAEMPTKTDEESDLFSPSTLSTLTHRPGHNSLPAVPLVVGTYAKKPRLVKQCVSTSHLEFLQLRFEDGKAEVEFVRIPMDSNASNKIKNASSSTLTSSGFVGVQHVRIRLANSAAWYSNKGHWSIAILGLLS
jgi:hypothetical protein